MTEPRSPLRMLLSRHTKRREFITLLGGVAAWPLTARAQQPDRMRRIGVLMAGAEKDPEGKVRAAVFERALQELGWTSGRNIRIEYRWAPAGDVADTGRCRGITETGTGCDPGPYHASDGGAATGVTYSISRLRGSKRTDRSRLCSEPGTSRRQHNRLHEFGANSRSEVASAAQGDCAARYTRRGFVQSEHCPIRDSILPFGGGSRPKNGRLSYFPPP